MNHKKMPVLFVGHGSPMNIIANNSFTNHLKKIGENIEKPKKILIVSAHWTTRGVHILNVNYPKTIYDFYGFPEELYNIKYPAKGDLSLTQKVDKNLKNYHPILDENWGYDHGTWSILHHMFPNADIPVVQLSLNENFTNLDEHIKLAKELNNLRNEGVLIIGSGNIVHNLRAIDQNPNAPVSQWAKEFDNELKIAILKNDLTQLTMKGSIEKKLWLMAHPSLEHYLPLLYVLGASDENENIQFPFEGFEHGSLSMRSVLIG